MAAVPGVLDFDGFFRAEYPKLVAIGSAMTGDHDTACELAQEALVRCLRNWARVSTMDVPGAWARRVLINLAIDAHRARGRARRVAARTRIEEAAGFDDPVIDGWWTAVRALPDRQRAAVVLHYVEDRPVHEVASILGIAEGTVKASLAKARTTLARALEKEG
ncbi:MAG: sigma-70 family RNA polymerase sigma factor [Ilumatobacteraceae bacterium]